MDNRGVWQGVLARDQKKSRLLRKGFRWLFGTSTATGRPTRYFCGLREYDRPTSNAAFPENRKLFLNLFAVCRLLFHTR